MLASSIFGLKTDMASINVLAEAKNAVDMRGCHQYKEPAGEKTFGMQRQISYRSGVWVWQCWLGLRLANLKQTRTFVRVVYHHSRMAMRSHLGGRDRYEALSAVESGKWDDLLE